MIKIEYELILYKDDLLSHKLIDKIPSDEEGSFRVFKFDNQGDEIDYIEDTLIRQGEYEIVHSKIQYQEEILDSVKYLTIHAKKRIGYPSGQSTYLERLFLNKNSKCKCKLTQKSEVSIDTIPNWEDYSFFAPFWLSNFLFTNKIVKEFLISSNLSGFKVLNVNKGIRKPIPLLNTYQIGIKNSIECFSSYNSEELHYTEICNQCGSVTLNLFSDTIMKFDFQEFPTSDDIFLIGNKFNFQDIIISQNFYRFLKENQFTHGLKIEPIFMSDELHMVQNTRQFKGSSMLFASKPADFKDGSRGRLDTKIMTYKRFSENIKKFNTHISRKVL